MLVLHTIGISWPLCQQYKITLTNEHCTLSANPKELPAVQFRQFPLSPGWGPWSPQSTTGKSDLSSWMDFIVVSCIPRVKSSRIGSKLELSIIPWIGSLVSLLLLWNNDFVIRVYLSRFLSKVDKHMSIYSDISSAIISYRIGWPGFTLMSYSYWFVRR